MKRTDRGEGNSLPPYPHQHEGPCLIAGNALCLPDDLSRARLIFPDAPVIAVNGAAGEIKAFALFSYHPEFFEQKGWIRKQRAFFGDGFTVHAVRSDILCPHVDHWWPKATGSGGSAWGARKVAGMMGFAPVVFVGCPLEVGPYTNHSAIGGLMHKENVVEDMRQGIASDTGWHDDVYSMSGFTRELFGEPC
jgi:hypothetical protein